MTEWSEWREVAREHLDRRVADLMRTLRVPPFRMLLVAIEMVAAIGVSAFIVSAPLTTALRPLLGLLLGMTVVLGMMWPGSGASVVLIMALGFSYVMVTSLGGSFGGALPPPFQVLGVAVGIYAVHAIDTYRATVAASVHVDSSIVTRWLRRQLETVAPTLILGAVVLLAPARGLDRLFWMVGALALLGAVGIPALLVRRSPWLDRSRARSGG